jgi:hypothetical protein
MILKSFKDVDISEIGIAIIVVYDKPSDYTNNVVARIYDLNLPTDTLILKDDISEVRKDILSTFGNVMCFKREEEDDKDIIESYLIG